MKNAFTNRVRAIIDEFNMIEKGDVVLVAVSGGPDSVALLHGLIALAGEYRLRLGVAHLNHGLRQTASDRDADFVAATAQQFRLPAHIEKKDVRQVQRRLATSLETAARRARYGFLFQIARTHGYAKVALGHHADDNAESVLMYLLRGSGPLGISGIAPVRGRIIRPLFRLTKAEILDYLRSNHLRYRVDRSNADESYCRNRIRHRLMPLLRRDFNPNIVAAINRLAEISRDEEDWIRSLWQPAYRKCCLQAESGTVSLSAKMVCELHPAAARRVIRAAIAAVKGDLRRIGFEHIEAVVGLVKHEAKDASVDLPDQVRVYRRHHQLIIRQEQQPLRGQPIGDVVIPEAEYRHVIPMPEKQSVEITFGPKASKLVFSVLPINRVPEWGSAGQRLAFFDMDKLSFPLTLRPVQPGDRFRPLGAGGQQKVKKYFCDHKIPRSQRWECPILLSQDHPVWLIGHRIDEYAKLRATTRRVLKVELLLA